MMNPVNIVVDIEIPRGKDAEFVEAVKTFGMRALTREPGCLRFEVSQMLDESGIPVAQRYIVNELYESMDARRAHGYPENMKFFNETIMPLMNWQRVLRSNVVGNLADAIRKVPLRADDLSEVTIIGEFETVEGAEEEFVATLIEHGERMFREEEGCLRYQVVKPFGEDEHPLPNRVMLNELFVNKAAVDVHQAGPWMGPFIARIAPLLKDQKMMLAKSTIGRVPKADRADHTL